MEPKKRNPVDEAPEARETTRPLPGSIEAEKSVLGAILQNSTLLLEASRVISEDDFYLESHRRLFRRMGDMVAEGMPLDLVTISEYLIKKKEISAVGGVGYIAGLPDRILRSESITSHLKIVKEKSLLRQVVSLSDSIANRAIDQSEEALAIAESMILQAQELNAHRPVEKLFVSAGDFMNDRHEQIDWMLQGVIQRGANGYIVADPKTGKSWAAIDMLISLATGTEWLGFRTPHPVRCALVSREDNPALTAFRMKRLIPGKLIDPNLLDENLLINTRAQSDRLMVDNSEDLRNLIAALREKQTEFVILDVFNRLHSADENDNTEMSQVLQNVIRIQGETGAGVGIVHHFNKSGVGSITQRLRGAGAIAGFAEWVIGISKTDDEVTRKMEFDIKADESPAPFLYRVDSANGITVLKRQEFAEPIPRKGSTSLRM